jgi:hypothetical protein
MRRVTVNVDIVFNVPDDYEVTDTETLHFPAGVVLHGDSGYPVENTRKVDHTSLETRDGE